MTALVKRTAIYLILIVLLAGALRIARAHKEKRFSVDAYLYFQMAENWAYHGSEYMLSYDKQTIPPLMLWVMAMGYNFGLPSDYTGLAAGIILGSLIPLAAFWIALNLFSHTKRENEDENALPGNYFYALLAAFLMAVSPFFVRISVSCLREIFYLPFMAFAMAFAISAIYNKSLWKWGAFAVMTVLATMSRREGVGLIVIFFVWQLVELVADRKNFRESIKYYALASVLVGGIFLGLMLPVLNFMVPRDSNIWELFFIS